MDEAMTGAAGRVKMAIVVALVTFAAASAASAQGCGFCANVPTWVCQGAEIQAPCHGWMDGTPEDPGPNQRGDDEHEGGNWEEGTCGAEHPEPCVPPFTDDALLAIMDAVANEHVTEVRALVRPVPGVWMEFNVERMAVQVIGVCEVSKRESVLLHLPVAGTAGDLWRAVLNPDPNGMSQMGRPGSTRQGRAGRR
jgi:hypothetical protein